MHLKGVWSWKVSGYLLRENPRAHANPQHPLVLGLVHTLVLFYVLIGEGKGAKCVMHQPSTLSPSISCTCHSSPGGRQMLSSLPLDRGENLQHRGPKSLAKAASAKSQDLTPGSLPMPPHVAGSLDQVIFFTLLLQVLSQHQIELGKDKLTTHQAGRLSRAAPGDHPSQHQVCPLGFHRFLGPHLRLHMPSRQPSTLEEELSSCRHPCSSTLAWPGIKAGLRVQPCLRADPGSVIHQLWKATPFP